MKYKIEILFISLTICLTLKISAQKSFTNDSLTIHQTLTNFYTWYIGAIQQHKLNEINPEFIETSKGQTTLNFDNYFDKLIQLKFSDSLIYKETQTYSNCIKELKKIKYSDFNRTYLDLDDFEKINCDFSNYYRFIGGQEPIEGFKIKSIHFNNPFYTIVNIELYDLNSEYLGSKIISLIKLNDNWLIENIN